MSLLKAEVRFGDEVFHLNEDGRAFGAATCTPLKAIVDRTSSFKAYVKNLCEVPRVRLLEMPKSPWEHMTEEMVSRVGGFLLHVGKQLGGTEALAWWGLDKNNKVVFALPRQKCSGGHVEAGYDNVEGDKDLTVALDAMGVSLRGTIHIHPGCNVEPSALDISSWTKNFSGLHFIVGQPTKEGTYPLSVSWSAISDSPDSCWTVIKEMQLQPLERYVAGNFFAIKGLSVGDIFKKEVSIFVSRGRSDWRGSVWDVDDFDVGLRPGLGRFLDRGGPPKIGFDHRELYHLRAASMRVGYRQACQDIGIKCDEERLERIVENALGKEPVGEHGFTKQERKRVRKELRANGLLPPLE